MRGCTRRRRAQVLRREMTSLTYIWTRKAHRPSVFLSKASIVSRSAHVGTNSAPRADVFASCCRNPAMYKSCSATWKVRRTTAHIPSRDASIDIPAASSTNTPCASALAVSRHGRPTRRNSAKAPLCLFYPPSQPPEREDSRLLSNTNHVNSSRLDPFVLRVTSQKGI